MIKILHLITGLDVGGAEMTLYKLLSRIDRSRFSNLVVSMTNMGSLGGSFQSSGIPVFTLDMRRGVPGPVGILRLLRLMSRERPDIIQTWLYHADLFGLLAGKLTGIPVILWNLRCSHMDMSRYSKLSTLVLRILSKLSSIPNAVLVNSQAGKRLHETMGYRPRRWVFIPNGFDTESFYPDQKARMALRRELGLSNDTILIGLVARFDPMKDHSNFLQAAGLLLHNSTNVHFVLVGYDVNYDNKELTEKIAATGYEKNFHLLGERSDIPYILAAFDIATSSSYGEGFPNVVGEAMACGVPCVVTDVGDSARIVGNTGRVVPPRDARALANGWQELIKMDHYQRQDLGLIARQRIMENFSLDAIVQQYELLYRDMVNKTLSSQKEIHV